MALEKSRQSSVWRVNKFHNVLWSIILETHNFATICIKQHQIIRVNELIRGVEIQEFSIEGLYPEMIGDPVNYSESAELSGSAHNHFDPDKIKSKYSKKKPIEIV